MARDSWVRRILLGRRDGVRAWLRQQTGVLAWLDETDEAAGELRDEPTEGPGTPAPSPTPGAGAASGRDGWVRVLDAERDPP